MGNPDVSLQTVKNRRYFLTQTDELKKRSIQKITNKTRQVRVRTELSVSKKFNHQERQECKVGPLIFKSESDSYRIEQPSR